MSAATFDPRWPNDVLNPAFRSLTASDFEVIELGWRGGQHSLCRSRRRLRRSSFSRAAAYVVLVWAGAAYAEEYVIEVGSAPGLSNVLVTSLGKATSVGTVAPPGRYYARIRAKNAAAPDRRRMRSW